MNSREQHGAYASLRDKFRSRGLAYSAGIRDAVVKTGKVLKRPETLGALRRIIGPSIDSFYLPVGRAPRVSALL